MKKMLFIIFFLLTTLTIYAQDDRKNSIRLGFGSVVSVKMESFSPVIDANYRRNLKGNFSLNVGYKFKECSYDTVYELRYNENISKHSVQYKGIFKSNSVYLGLTYSIKVFDRLYFIPTFNAGVGYALYDYAIPHFDTGEINRYEENGKFIYINPSVYIEYDMKLFRLYCSYSYDMPFIKNGFKSPFMDCEARTNRTFKTSYYFLGDLRLGVAFKF